MDIDEGETVTVIGANGAGKTTVLNAISAIHRIVAGSIKFDNTRIDGCSAEPMVGMSVLHVPVGRRVFGGLSVEENLLDGATNWYRFGDGTDRHRERDKGFGIFHTL